MAVVATFRADFSDFIKKAEAAQGSLDKMQQAAGVTAGKVKSLENAFGGQRIVMEALAAVDAIEKIGGVSKLTEAEMARVNRTTSEAVAKMKALGLEVPPEIAKLHAATMQAAGSTQQLGAQTTTTSRITQEFTGAIGKMAAAFSVGALIDRTVGAVFSFGAAAIESAGKLTDLRNKTGLSLSLLQEMQVVAEQTGTSLDVFTNAAYQLSLRLASNTDILQELGLSYVELRKLSPDDQFRKVITALEGVDDIQERARIGAELYGSKVYKEIAPAVTEGWSNIAGSIRKANDEQLEAIDAASDGWTMFKRDITTTFQQVAGVWANNYANHGKLTEEQTQHLRMLQRTGQDAHGYLQRVTAERIAAEQAAQPVEQKRTEIARDYVKELDAQTQKVKALTPATIAQITAAQKLGASEEDLIRQFGVSEMTIKLLNEQKKEAAKQATEYEARAKKAQDATDKFAKSVRSLAGNFVELKPAIDDAGVSLQNIARGLEADGTLLYTSINESAKASAAAKKATEEWAMATGAVLAPSISNISTLLTDTGTKSVSMFSNLMQGVPQSILAAIQGGGSIVGAAGASIGTNLMQSFTTKFGPAITAALPFGIGSAITALLPTLGPMFGPVAEKIAGFFKQIFGGPSQEELRGRQAVADFEKQLAGLLTQTQKNEAGNESWKMTVIAIRDAYIAMGRTEQEALADAERLWKSSKQGAQASAAIIAEIEAKMKAQGQTAVEAVEKIGQALDDLPREIDITINTQQEGSGERVGEGYARGTKARTGSWFRNFGGGTLTRLHGDEAVVPRGQAAAFAEATGAGAMSDAVAAEVAGLRADFAMLPTMIGRAVRDAVLVAG